MAGPLRGAARVSRSAARLPTRRSMSLDAAAQPVPVGVAGELYVGGRGGGAGVSGPAGADGGALPARPVRPGRARGCIAPATCVRWRADGQLEFLGRADEQVKLRGYPDRAGGDRGDAAHRTPRCAEAVVVRARGRAAGDPRLVAYVVGAGGRRPRRACCARICRSACPSTWCRRRIVPLDRLPLTPNGKVDRAALPAPERHATEAATCSRRRRRSRKCSRASGRRCCSGSGSGRTDNFFEHGGHSLLATQVIARVRQRRRGACRCGRCSTRRRWRGWRGRSRRRGSGAGGAAGDAGAPRPARCRCRSRSSGCGSSISWTGPAGLQHAAGDAADGPLEVAGLAAALTHVAARHEALRTRFAVVDGTAGSRSRGPRRCRCRSWTWRPGARGWRGGAAAAARGAGPSTWPRARCGARSCCGWGRRARAAADAAPHRQRRLVDGRAGGGVRPRMRRGGRGRPPRSRRCRCSMPTWRCGSAPGCRARCSRRSWPYWRTQLAGLAAWSCRPTARGRRCRAARARCSQ